MTRDTQRAKLYKAEREALAPLETNFGTVDRCKRYICKCCARATIKARYGQAVGASWGDLNVKDGRGTRNALAYGTRTISLPAGWARTDRVALHELAHIIHNRLPFAGSGSRVEELRGGADHGWQFAAIYLDLVQFCMGPEAARALKDAFRKGGVRFRPKVKRILSNEQRARVLSNLALAQAARAARPKDD